MISLDSIELGGQLMTTTSQGTNQTMKFFIDTADINEIKELAATGLVDGVTTNPSLVAKSGRKFLDVVREICEVVPGPVSAEVVAPDHATMLKEADKLSAIPENLVVKVPLTVDGRKTSK